MDASDEQKSWKAFVEKKKLTKHIESIHASANKGILTEEIKEREDTNQISNDSMMAEMGKSEDINQTSYGSVIEEIKESEWVQIWCLIYLFSFKWVFSCADLYLFEGLSPTADPF